MRALTIRPGRVDSVSVDGWPERPERPVRPDPAPDPGGMLLEPASALAEA